MLGTVRNVAAFLLVFIGVYFEFTKTSSSNIAEHELSGFNEVSFGWVC